jgi:rubredoxin
MKSGHCPKCGATTVHSLPNGLQPGGRRDYIGFGGVYSGVPVQSYVCTTCGYYENYLADPQKLAEVAQKWPLIPPKS